LPNVNAVHDLHVWGICTLENTLTAHVELDRQLIEHDELLSTFEGILHHRFAIHHTTIQFESVDYAVRCALNTG
jgi:cobalt-zinc-cadmium efflux system protein